MEELRGFLEALLNRNIQDDDTIRLSSAQTARVVMWAQKNSFVLDMHQIRHVFTLSSLAQPTTGAVSTGLQKDQTSS